MPESTRKTIVRDRFLHLFARCRNIPGREKDATGDNRNQENGRQNFEHIYLRTSYRAAAGNIQPRGALFKRLLWRHNNGDFATDQPRKRLK